MSDSGQSSARMKTHAAVTGGGSALARYRRVIVGGGGLLHLVYFEWCALLSNCPGAAGLFLRKLFWPRLFGACGRGCTFGAGVTLRHPMRIRLGRNVVIGDGCVLDARTPELDAVISIGDDVILSNGVMISCKGGHVTVGRNVGIGPASIIQTSEELSIGDDSIIGPMCYITGGGNYNTERLDVPIRTQGMRRMGGTRIGNDVWLGARATVLGGVSVGAGSIVGAGAVVTGAIEPGVICAGVPARVIRRRDGEAAPK